MPQIISCHVSAFHRSLLGVFVLLSAEFAIYFNRKVYACDISAHVLFSFLLVCHELGLFLQQVRYNGKVFFRHMIFQAQHVVIFHWASAQNVRTFVLLLVILHWKHHKPHTILHFFAVFHLWFFGQKFDIVLGSEATKTKVPCHTQ